MTVGENICRLRREQGLTQKQLGERLNMSQSAIGQFENNKTSPKLETIQKIAHALGVGYLDILRGTSDGREIFFEQTEEGGLIDYLEILGYIVYAEITKWHYEGKHQIMDEYDHVLIQDKHGNSAFFTREEFDELQSMTKEIIEGAFYKKVLQQDSKNIHSSSKNNKN